MCHKYTICCVCLDMASPGIYCHWHRITKEGKPISMSNQNPFADPSVISFADLRERILQNDALNFPRRREIASAINTAASRDTAICISLDAYGFYAASDLLEVGTAWA